MQKRRKNVNVKEFSTKQDCPMEFSQGIDAELATRAIIESTCLAGIALYIKRVRTSAQATGNRDDEQR